MAVKCLTHLCVWFYKNVVYSADNATPSQVTVICKTVTSRCADWGYKYIGSITMYIPVDASTPWPVSCENKTQCHHVVQISQHTNQCVLCISAELSICDSASTTECSECL